MIKILLSMVVTAFAIGPVNFLLGQDSSDVINVSRYTPPPNWGHVQDIDFVNGGIMILTENDRLVHITLDESFNARETFNGMLQFPDELNPRSLQRINVHDDIAFFSFSEPGGLFAFDVSDPASPEFISWLDTGEIYVSADKNIVQDNLFFAVSADGENVHIIDIADPNNMRVVYEHEFDGLAHSIDVQDCENLDYG